MSADAAVSCVVRLALGRSPAVAPDWQRVFEVAALERCAPLAWLRSGSTIRAQAPADVVARWRTAFLTVEARTRRLELLAERCVLALERGGVHAVVLKGLPLARRLYGDTAARPTDDLDLWVAEPQRARARAILLDDGWHAVSGRPPWDELFDRPGERAPDFLELHSSLVCDGLRHLALPPPSAVRVPLGAAMLPAFDGELLPVYLAAHLAQHQLPPLLWFLDFTTLWSGLAEAQRASSRIAAKRVGLRRWLDWGLARADALQQLAEGRVSAARTFGIRHERRTDVHQYCRMIALSDGLSDAGRVLMAWLWPRWLAPDRETVTALYKRRVRKSWRGLLVTTRRYHACRDRVKAPGRGERVV